MNDFKLGQDFVTRCTSDTDANDVSVIGDCRALLPTAEEFRAIYKSTFVARFVEFGIPADVGEHEFACCDWEDIRNTPAADAADECMSYWDAE